MPTNWTVLTANCNTGAIDMMHKRNIWVGAVVGTLVGFFGPVASAQADTIYSNFGAGYSYGATGWTIGGPAGGFFVLA